jgi:exosortase D (VPLPA-CTERM-specific)
MFPLMTMAFIVAYFFQAPFWKRAALFFSSVPIAVLMNSLRIGVIGITVEYWGPKMAEGVLHDFEGWVVFMLSTGVLILVAIALTRIGRSKQSWRDALTIDLGPSLSGSASELPRALSPAFYGATALAAAAAVLSFTMPERTEPVMPRSAFADFPSHIGDWRGRQEVMESVYLDKLHLDDYVMANYSRDAVNPVNLYVAYYASQRKGQSTHSPRSCIPGGGWIIRSFEQRALPVQNAAGTPLSVNRVVVEYGLQRQIVYYWFQQRGRFLTNEYQVKWYIFWDALTRNRTDGALVRLAMPTRPGVSEAQVDRELTQFAAQATPLLTKFIPD